MKIVNFKKFIRSICIVLGVIFVLSLIFAKGTLSYKEVEFTKLCVASGDTLWNIAEELQSTNNYYSNKDIRYIISDIKDINNLESSNIYSGQELMIPII